MLPQTIQSLINILMKLSGVGEKTAQRYAFEMLNWRDEELESMSETVGELHIKIKHCEKCGNLTESKYCDICSDTSRNDKLICVVGSVKDLIAIERTQQYNGIYHVLKGLISITNGVYPEDLEIDQLVDKCVENKVEEVILALNLNVDGETTALYIAKKLESKNIQSSRLASGLPMGGNIEFADQLTLLKAFEGRKRF